MFTPRGYTAVPQDASQDEDENDNLTKSFEQRKTWSASRANSTSNSMNASRTSRDNEEGEKQRQVKRNVRFESRSLEDKAEPMSNARRLCFVASLMICTLTIFVFAFTVPCKGPSCNVANMITTVTSNVAKNHRNWSVTFSGYSTGIVFHLSASKTEEIIVSYDGKPVKSERKHRNEGSGLFSLKEKTGELVWVYNASDVTKLIECRTDANNFETCLLQSSHGKLQLINPSRNQIVWSTRILIGSLLPSIVIGINDCDGDGGRDILLSYDHFNTTCMPPLANKTICTHPGIVQLISGRTGYPLGSRLNIPQSHLIKRVSVHSTGETENLIFVLTVGNKGHLKVISIQELYRKILEARGDDSVNLFKNSTASVSDIVSTDHEPILKDLNKDFVEDIILVTLAGSKHSLTAVDGGKFKKMWRIAFGSRKMLSQPVIGHFNDDEIPDILVILEDPVLSLLNQSLVQILDGQNGNILWSRKLRLAKNTSPLAANIGYKSDLFLLWIEKDSKRKYRKIFPSKGAKDNQVYPKIENHRGVHHILSSHSDYLSKNAGENTIAPKVEHHRSPRSVQSSEKTKSSLSDMESELDTLVDEIYEKNIKNTPRTEPREKPHLKPKKIESTHKFIQDFLKEEGKQLKVVNRESLSDERKKAENTASTTQRPVLVIHPVRGEPNRRRVGQMMVNSPGSRINTRESRPTTTLVTRHPLVHKVRVNTITKKPGIKLSSREKVGDSLLENRANSEGHRSPTISATKRQQLLANTPVPTKKPSTKVSNGKKGQPMINNSGGGAKTWAAKLFISPANNHGTAKELRTEIINKKRVGNDVTYSPSSGTHDGTKIGIAAFATKRPNVLTTIVKKPTIKISSKEKVQQVTIENRDNRINGKRLNAIRTSPTERSLQQNELHITEKPSTTMADSQRLKQVVIDSIGDSVNDDKQSSSTTLATRHPESHSNVKIIISEPTARIVSSARVEDIVHNPISIDQASTTVKLNDIRFAQHNVASPTPLAKDQLNIKTSFHNARKISEHDKNKLADVQPTHKSTKHSTVKSDVKQVPQNNVEIPKTQGLVSGTSIPHPLNHSVGDADITMGRVTDSKSENTQKSLRNGNDIVSPTKSLISGEPTGYSGIGLQNKRLLKVNEPTATIKNNSVISDGDSGNKQFEVDIDHGIENEVAPNVNNTDAASSTKLRLIHGLPNEENGKIFPGGRQDVLKNKTESHLPGLATTLPNTTNELADFASLHNTAEKAVQYDKEVINLSDNRNQPAYNKSNGESNANHTRFVLSHHDSEHLRKPKQSSQARQGKNALAKVLPKVGDNKGNAGHRNKITNVLHSMKLNGTNHSNVDKSGEVKPATPNGPDLRGASLEQQSSSLNTTRVNHHKLADFHATKEPRTGSPKRKHIFECNEGFDLALIAIFPNSERNSFSVISQENSARKKKYLLTPSSCDTVWPTLNSSPLVHDADSDGFLEIMYAVNYGSDEEDERTMNIRMFSIKVDSE